MFRNPCHALYYEDYTLNGCLANAYTPLTVNQQLTITVKFLQLTTTHQSFRVWIDYNNNGAFETSELVASGNNVPAGPDGYATFTASFTPPSTAVMNTPLRMRVLADMNNPGSYAPCGQLGSGQIEDYAVPLVTAATPATHEAQADTNDFVIYPNPAAGGGALFIKAGNREDLKVSISDRSGRLISSPAVTKAGKDVYTIGQQLEKGVYMIQVSNGTESKTSELIVN